MRPWHEAAGRIFNTPWPQVWSCFSSIIFTWCWVDSKEKKVLFVYLFHLFAAYADSKQYFFGPDWPLFVNWSFPIHFHRDPPVVQLQRLSPQSAWATFLFGLHIRGVSLSRPVQLFVLRSPRHALARSHVSQCLDTNSASHNRWHPPVHNLLGFGCSLAAGFDVNKW